MMSENGKRDAEDLPAEEFVAPAVEDADGGAAAPVATREAAPAPPPRYVPEDRPARNPVVRGLGHVYRTLNIRGIKGGYGAYPLIALMGINVVQLFQASAFTLLLPDIQREFQLNLSALILIATYTAIVAALLAGPIGYMGDRWKRNRMVTIGGAVSTLGSLLLGVAPNKAALIVARTVADNGSEMLGSVQFSLIADYYPMEERGRAFSFRFMGGEIARLIAPMTVALLGVAWGWRAPFLIFTGIGLLFTFLLFRLKEPVRGYHERRSYGADEATAMTEQVPPSWGEAWRAAWGIRTVRRIAYSYPIDSMTAQIQTLFFALFLFNAFNLDTLERGYMFSAIALAGIAGLALGGGLVSSLIGRNPGRVVIYTGVAEAVAAVLYGIVIVSRWLPLALGAMMLSRFLAATLRPARISVYSSVIPPRLRNLGLSVLAYFEIIPTLIGFSIAQVLANQAGLRVALFFTVPLSLISAVIVMTAGPYVEFDIRSANAAAMAGEVWRRAKAEGRAKMCVIRDLDLHYGSVQVLFGVDLDIEEGEILALLGTNGAGKSTLLKAITGVQQATGGAVVFDGRDVTRIPPNEIVRHGIVHMPGGRGIFPGMTVRENLHLAGWLYGQDPKHAEEVEQIFGYFPVLRQRLDQLAGTLSGGEQQMLALSQAFLSRPRMLCIDELSLGLSPAVVEQLLNIIRAIHAQGTTIVLVEQSVNVALTVAKRAVFMEKGEIRFDGPTAELLERPDILRAVFLKGAAAAGPATAHGKESETPDRAAFMGVQRRRGVAADAADILVVEGLEKGYGGIKAVDGASFTLREGEILGFIGPNGAGKTTVLEMISGFVMPDAGRVVYEGRDITTLLPDERAKLRMLRRFQDANLFPSLTVVETLSIAFELEYDVRSVFLEGLGFPQARVAEQRIRKRVDRLVEMFELEGFADKFIGELSTGTRRVVDIACVLAAEPKVLLLDEPSSGMAQREAENLVPLLLRVRQETGCSMVVIEHDIPLISNLADELVAMDLGRVVIRGAPEVVLENEHVVRSYLGTSEEVIKRSGATR